jgi:Geranylgeranyl pyrophosphate synthase
MQEVDAVIQRRLVSEVLLVEQVARYIIEAGGKRMRPALLLLSSKALGDQPPETPRPPMAELAAIIEFIHTATLLHDDVVDESGLRRSRETPMPSLVMPQAFWSETSCTPAPFR